MSKLKELCFEITNNCHLSCIYCSSFDDILRKRDLSYLPFLLIKKIIDDFCSLGGEILELSGGEPLLHPQIFDIVDYALRKKLDVIIYTSGVLPDPYDIKYILDELKNIGLKKIVFNCQGLRKTHDSLARRKGAFSKLESAIKYSKKIYLWVGVHFVPNKQNFSQIRPLYKFLKEQKVDELALLRLVRQGRAKQNWSKLEMDSLNYLSFFKDVYNLARNRLPLIRVGCPFDFMKILYADWPTTHECHAGRSSLNIMANGDILPCPAFKDILEARLGNIFNDSLKVIWNRSSLLKLLREINASPSKISFCNECEFLNECKGRCAAQRILENKSLVKGPDPLCEKLRLYDFYEIRKKFDLRDIDLLTISRTIKTDGIHMSHSERNTLLRVLCNLTLP